MVARIFFAIAGFSWIKTKGKIASRREAPMIVMSPHSSFFDALPVIYHGAPSVVAKGELGNVPIWGSMCIFL